MWKINNALMLDEGLTSQINIEIQITVSIYSYTPDFIMKYTKENIVPMIGIDLFWGVHFVQIK